MCTSNSQKVVAFVLANGDTVRSYAGKTVSEISVALEQHAARNTVRTFGVNLYNASNAPFCLGASLHSSVSAARSAATRGTHLSSFELKVNGDGRIMPYGNASSASYIRYALFNGSKFRKPSYASAHEARSAARSGDRVVEIGISGANVVSIREV